VTRFRFVEQEKERYPVRILCSALGVSPSGCYAWRSRGPSARAISYAALATEIRRSHARSRGTYGVPRIHADLAEAGHHVARKRVARLMRAEHLAGVHRRRFVRTTIRDEHAAPFRTSSTATSRRRGPTGSGSPTSPSCRRGAAPATSPRSSTPSAAGSWAGAWRPTCGPSSSPPPSPRRSSTAARAPGHVPGCGLGAPAAIVRSASRR
jgi:transposase InsO family protein